MVSSDFNSAVNSAIVFLSSLLSVSNSILLILVRRRSGISRIYVTCSSFNLKSLINFSLAAAASSLPRMILITLSMSIIALSKPSTRVNREVALALRNSERRRTTSIRCSINTSNNFFRPRVCGRPFTRATLFIAKASSIGVNLNSCSSTFSGSKPFLISITTLVPVWPSVKSMISEIP